MLNMLKDRLRGAQASGREDTRSRLAATVIQGSDAYLFHRDGYALQQVTGERPLDTRALNLWISSLETRKAWCEARGITFRFLVVPEKHVVYSDKLPDRMTISENRPARQILSGLDESTRSAALYPLAEMQAGRSVRDTYYVTDSHWTTYGALLGCRVIGASLQAERPFQEVPDAELAWLPRPNVGDLGVRLEPEQEETVDVVAINSSCEIRTVFQNKLFARGSLMVLETNRPELPRGVLFRDSFAVNMIHVLVQSFSRLVVVGSQSVHYDLLRQERPDIVIAETCERFLGMPDPAQAIELPQDLDGPDFPTFTGVPFSEFAAKAGAGGS